MLEDQTTQAHCHTLVTNACVLWTTQYYQRSIDQHESATSTTVPAAVIARMSPGRFEHINPYGTYFFDLETISEPISQRPLRTTQPR